MTRVQYTVNSLALLAIAVGLAVYDIRTLGCLLMACILSAASAAFPARHSHGHRHPSPSVGTLSPRCGEREAVRQCAMRTEIPSPRAAGRMWPKSLPRT